MLRSFSILLIGLIGLIPGSSFGSSSVCSNPARARVLARATIFLPSDNIGTLEHRFAIIAPKIGMSTWGTGLDERGKILAQTLGLQSPKVSVSIQADWKPGQRAALLSIERTCIDDTLEPWRGYWWGLIGRLESAGYRVTPRA